MKKVFALVCLMALFGAKVNASSKVVSDIARWGIPIYALGMTMQEETNEGTWELFYSALGAQLASETLKKITQEKRPDYEAGDRKDSFPSGHAVGAFSGAMFIHRRYGAKFAYVPYVLATFTGFQRVSADRHHPHDVIAGAVLAGLFTYLFVDERKSVSFSTNADGDVKVEYKVKY